MEYTQVYMDRCIKQHQSHTKNLQNGDRLIAIQGGLYDLFTGKGWKNLIRFRIVHLKQNNTSQLIQVSGPTLSRDYRTYLFKELTA